MSNGMNLQVTEENLRILGCDQNNVDITVLQGASVTLVTYLIPAQAWSIIPTLSRDCQMSNTFRAT